MVTGPDGSRAQPSPAQTSSPAAIPDYGATVQQGPSDPASGSGTLADQAAVMQGSAANLVAAAGSGFHLEAETAAILIASVRKAQDILQGRERHTAKLREAPQLGDLDYAKRVSSFTQNVATDGKGMVQGVLAFEATLAQMEQAYLKAVGNYQDIEQRISDSMTRLTQGIAANNTPPPYRGGPRAV